MKIIIFDDQKKDFFVSHSKMYVEITTTDEILAVSRRRFGLFAVSMFDSLSTEFLFVESANSQSCWPHVIHSLNVFHALCARVVRACFLSTERTTTESWVSDATKVESQAVR
jgi:hypothetical protein